jgi:hypothetical protein
MLRRGDYVLCNFPFRESGGPGPSPHVVLCAATGREGDVSFAIVFYTTSRIDYEGVRRPRQFLFVDKAGAIELGQRVAFHVDASRIARLPLTVDYFPGLRDKSVEVIGRDPNFAAKVEERLGELIAAGFEITRVDAVQYRQGRPR